MKKAQREKSRDIKTDIRDEGGKNKIQDRVYQDRRELEREQQKKKRCSPVPTTPCLFLSKESSVLAKKMKPLSPCAGALCPGATVSFGAGSCRAWLASAKLGISQTDNWQIRVQQDIQCYRWKDLAFILLSIPFLLPNPFLMTPLARRH